MIKKEKIKLPKYVKLRHSALRLKDDKYYRDAGSWSVSYKVVDNKLFSVHKYDNDVNNVELIECTKEEWKKDNWGYI